VSDPLPARPRRRWPWLVAGAAVLALPAALLAVNGCTPLVVSEELARQGGTAVVVERSIPWGRWSDLSFRMACTVSLVRADGARQLLYDSDDGSRSHRITVQALPAGAGHQLLVKAADGRTLAVARFRFD
jgi:hypothetical protein